MKENDREESRIGAAIRAALPVPRPVAEDPDRVDRAFLAAIASPVPGMPAPPDVTSRLVAVARRGLALRRRALLRRAVACVAVLLLFAGLAVAAGGLRPGRDPTAANASPEEAGFSLRLSVVRPAGTPCNPVAALDPSRIRSVVLCAPQNGFDEMEDATMMREVCRVEDPGAIAEMCAALRLCTTNLLARAETGPFGRQAFLDSSNRVLAVVEPWLGGGGVAIVPGDGWSLADDGRLVRDPARAPSPDKWWEHCWSRSFRYQGLVLDRLRADAPATVARFDERYAEIPGGVEAVLFSLDDDGPATNGVRLSRKEVEARETVSERMRASLEGVILPEISFSCPEVEIFRRLERAIRDAGGISSFRLHVDPASLRAIEEEGGRCVFLFRGNTALGAIEEVAACTRHTPCFDEDGVVLVPERNPSVVAAVSSRAGRIDVRRRVLGVFDRTPFPSVAVVAADTREVVEGFNGPFDQTRDSRLLEETSPSYCLSMRFQLEAAPVPIASGDLSLETNGFARVFGTPDTDCPDGTWWLHGDSAESATILLGGPSFRVVLDDFAAAFGLVWDVREDYTVVFSPAEAEPRRP